MRERERERGKEGFEIRRDDETLKKYKRKTMNGGCIELVYREKNKEKEK